MKNFLNLMFKFEKIKIPVYNYFTFYWKFAQKFEIDEHFEIISTPLKTKTDIIEFTKKHG